MTLVIDSDTYLEHFGKKGMRWGHRKKVKTPLENDALNDIKTRASIGWRDPAAKKAINASIKNKKATVPGYTKVYNKTEKEYWARQKKKDNFVTAATLVGVGASYLYADMNMRPERYKRAASSAGNAYRGATRRATESSVDRFLRNNGSDIASRIGGNFIDVNNGYPGLNRGR